MKNNSADEFNPAWINVIGENMMEWFNKCVPRFVFIGRKAHLLGNERHTICCDVTYVC